MPVVKMFKLTWATGHLYMYAGCELHGRPGLTGGEAYIPELERPYLRRPRRQPAAMRLISVSECSYRISRKRIDLYK